MNQNCFIFIKQHKNFNMLNFLKSEMKNGKQDLKTDDSLFKKIKRFLESKKLNKRKKSNMIIHLQIKKKREKRYILLK